MELKDKVVAEIKKIYDPEIPVNIFELGLIYDISIKDKNVMWAPMYDNLRLDKDYWNIIKYLNIKVLCFSKKVQEIAKRHKCNHKKGQRYDFDLLCKH